MDRLEAMSLLVTSIEVGSLSGASRRLGIPLPTVSRKISELEAHLNTRLLTRTTRRLALTDAGQSYVAACKRILEEIAEAERAATGEYSAPKGELVVTAPIVFGRLHVLPVVTQFLQAYPEIDIRLVLSDRLANLVEDRVDLAVRIGPLPDSSLVATRIGAIRRIVCGSPSYFARRGAPQNPRDLSAHECVAFEGLMASDRWVFPSGKSELSVPIHSRLIVTTAEAAIDAAVAGLGLTRVLSYQVAAALHAGSLALALEQFEPAPWPVNLVYPGGRILPLKLRAFYRLRNIAAQADTLRQLGFFRLRAAMKLVQALHAAANGQWGRVRSPQPAPVLAWFAAIGRRRCRSAGNHRSQGAITRRSTDRHTLSDQDDRSLRGDG